MASASFTKTQRGSTKLVHEGYSYNVIRYGNNGRIYWRCDEARLQCKGSVATDKDNKVSIGKLHNHAPSTARVHVKMVKTYIREAALQTGVPSRDVVSNVIDGVSDSVRRGLPPRKTLEQTVNRKRKLVEGREAETKPTSFTKTTLRQTAAPYCAICGCRNGDTHGNKSQRSLFAVPKNPGMRKQWCESLGQELFDGDQICELHFDKNDIVTFHMRVSSDDTIHLRINGQPTLAEGAIPIRKRNVALQVAEDALSSDDPEDFMADFTNSKVENEWNETLDSSSLINLPNSSQIQNSPTENSCNSDGGVSYLVVIEEDSSSDEFFPEHNYSMSLANSSKKRCFEQTISSELKNEEKKEPEILNQKPETVNQKPPESVKLKRKTKNQEPETVKPKSEPTKLEPETMDSDECNIDTIKNHFRNNPLPKTWAWTDCSNSTGIVLTQISNKTKRIRCHLECNKDLRVQAYTFDKLQVKDIDTTVKSIEELLQLLELATTLYLCEGIIGGKRRAVDCVVVIPVREQFKKRTLFNRCTACRDYLKLLKRNRRATQKKLNSVLISKDGGKGI